MDPYDRKGISPKCPKDSGLGILSTIIGPDSEFSIEKTSCDSRHSNLGGSNIFEFSPLYGEDIPIWRAYFSDGLVQPPTRIFRADELFLPSQWEIDASHRHPMLLRNLGMILRCPRRHYSAQKSIHTRHSGLIFFVGEGNYMWFYWNRIYVYGISHIYIYIYEYYLSISPFRISPGDTFVESTSESQVHSRGRGSRLLRRAEAAALVGTESWGAYCWWFRNPAFTSWYGKIFRIL